jgi:NDP-sugar pyrophosphorylase family protein
MIGMILCGGLGKRFRPLTEEIPKALLELKEGYTMLDRQLFQYKSARIDRVLLLTAHLGEKIEERFGKEHMGIKLEYVREEKPLGTLNAIRLGMRHAREDAVVSNGDVIADLNLKRMCEEWKKSGTLGSIFITPLPSPYGIIELKGQRIVGFREKPLLDYYINAGFYCLSKRVLPVLEKFKVGDIERTAFPELAAKKQLVYYKEEALWMSIDTPKDFEAVKMEYTNRVDKPWGYEKIVKSDKKRMEKLIYIMAGYRTSLHYHEVRDERLRVLRGTGLIEYKGGRRKRFKKGSEIHIKPGTVHSLLAEENALFHETSTFHPNDVVRVKDFYEFRLK